MRRQDRHPRGVFIESEVNGIIPVCVWLSTGERAIRTEYLARYLTDDEIVRLYRELEVMDPTRVALVG